MKPTVSVTRIARPSLGRQRADGGVERREQLVGDEHVRAGEGAHQRRLARVRVPDERDARHLLTPRPSCLRLVVDGGQLRLELGDAVADLAAIELDGGLPRAPQPDAAALALAAAGLAQPRSHVREPRNLDLQARRSARRVTVEDLDDHARAIEDRRGRGRALEVAELARGQLVVDDDDGGARLPVGAGGASRCAARSCPPLRLLRSLSSCRGGPWGRRPCHRSRRPAPPACPRRAAWPRRGPCASASPRRRPRSRASCTGA